MRFSIIIPTYNEAKNIVSLLDQIKHLVADDTEIIIVDDNSPDGTADIVRKLISYKRHWIDVIPMA